ncbi:MAG: MBL fold metallo-hydrolase [Polyangiaceae bacterium]|nr:MBL fold metallo-hydrolase [Polyangiaceae bacterium]
MKTLHRPDLFAWSRFDEARNIDFNGYVWVRPEGNVLIDPLAMSEHDLRHLKSLGGAGTVVITNSDHVRAAPELAARFGAELCGPRAERDGFPCACARWLGEGDEVVPGLVSFELHGSKSPGELALLLDGTTLFTGDLVRSHHKGGLDMLPAAKVVDRAAAVASIARLAALPEVEAVLVGDGWPVFRDGARALGELARRAGN